MMAYSRNRSYPTTNPQQVSTLPTHSMSYPTCEGAQHGDDLGLLFKPQDIYGNPIEGDELTDNDDASVADYYLSMVSEFARTGTPKLNGGFPWMPFSPEKNNYMSITNTPKQKNDFNKCEMGLWTGNANILKSVECSEIGEAAMMVVDLLGGTGTGLITAVKGTTDGLTTGLNNVTKPLETGLADVTKPLETGLTKPITNLLGGNTRPTRPQSSNNLLGGVGGFLG